jgi:hypothetical protein
MVADTTVVLAFSVKHEIFLNAAVFILSIGKTEARGAQGTALLHGTYSQRVKYLV